MSGSRLGSLVDPDWLAEQLAAPDVRVIDGSYYLPDAGRDPRAEFLEAAIPGAVYLDLATDLADSTAAVRNTVARPEALASRLGEAGISHEHRIVVYDHLGGFSAGRIWWILQYLGHPNTALLDGGILRWLAEGHPVEPGSEQSKPIPYQPKPTPEWLVLKQDVLDAIQTRTAQLIDAREDDRFRGEGPEPTRYKGHMPGARNVPYTENLTGDPPRLKTATELRSLYEAIGIDFDRPVITTCGSGVTASLGAFALKLAGHPRVSVYDGSWAEWGNTEGLPVETGPARPGT